MLKEHLGYMADQTRLKQFRTAIAHSVRPGDLVADLGCGTGILGLLCLEAGALKVFEIECTGMVEIARDTFRRAGLDERATFIHGYSLRLDHLPEQVDLVICDYMGYFGFDYDLINTI